jgi:hypothetical protein
VVRHQRQQGDGQQDQRERRDGPDRQLLAEGAIGEQREGCVDGVHGVGLVDAG